MKIYEAYFSGIEWYDSIGFFDTKERAIEELLYTMIDVNNISCCEDGCVSEIVINQKGESKCIYNHAPFFRHTEIIWMKKRKHSKQSKNMWGYRLLRLMYMKEFRDIYHRNGCGVRLE